MSAKVKQFKGRNQASGTDGAQAVKEVFLAVDQATMMASLLSQMNNESREARTVQSDSLDRIIVRLDTLRAIAPDRFHKVMIEVDIRLTTAGLKLPENSI